MITLSLSFTCRRQNKQQRTRITTTFEARQDRHGRASLACASPCANLWYSPRPVPTFTPAHTDLTFPCPCSVCSMYSPEPLTPLALSRTTWSSVAPILSSSAPLELEGDDLPPSPTVLRPCVSPIVLFQPPSVRLVPTARESPSSTSSSASDSWRGERITPRRGEAIGASAAVSSTQDRYASDGCNVWCTVGV